MSLWKTSLVCLDRSPVRRLTRRSVTSSVVEITWSHQARRISRTTITGTSRMQTTKPTGWFRNIAGLCSYRVVSDSSGLMIQAPGDVGFDPLIAGLFVRSGGLLRRKPVGRLSAESHRRCSFGGMADVD